MSRGGYDWLRERLEAERQARMEEESEGSVVSNPEPFERHIQWCEGRKKRSGEYVNEKVEEGAHRIVSSIFIYTDLVTVCSD